MGNEGSKGGIAKHQMQIPPETKNIEDVFKIGKELGRGHFACVKVATDRRTGKQVAIKIIQKKEMNKNAESVKMEVRVLMEVGSHPYIVNLIDTFEDSSRYYLVMEFATGGDLFSRIVEEGTFSEAICIRFCRQLAQAIQYIHSKGISHRDLKPENILLNPTPSTDGKARNLKDLANWDLKVADFGLSKILPEPTSQMRTVCGTWAYCAPEVINRQKYSAEVDNWTLGVLMFILLSGYHPFDMYGDLPEPQLLRNIRICKYDFNDEVWDSVSNDAKDLIRGLLQVDPRKRITLEQYLSSDWIMREGSADVDMSHVAQRMKANVDPRRRFRGLILAKLAAAQFRRHMTERVAAKDLRAAVNTISQEAGVQSPARDKETDADFDYPAPMEDEEKS